MSHTRTLLIGLDGATFTVLDPLMEEGVMPFLREFVASGARAPLRSVVPALTPPAWTSLTTGRSPGHHGIFDFFCRDSPDSRDIRVATGRDVRAETVWSIADRAGLRATVLNFPLMFPAPAIRGFVVPGWMPWRQLRLGCHPEDLFDRLKRLPGLEPRELAMDMAIEAKALEGCRTEEFEEWIELHTRREKQWFRILEHLMREEPCDLTAILFDGVDKIQHLCWRFLDPARGEVPDSDWARRIRELCVSYFRDLDGLLARAVELAGPDATVVMASDHGAGPQTGTFFVNAWLERQGYLSWADGMAPNATDPSALGLSELARHTYQLDWEKTRAYAPTPSSNGIHIVVAGENSEHGVPREEYESFRDELVERLRGVTDPANGSPVCSRIWTREEVFDGPYRELAPDLSLELSDGGLISILASDEVYQRRVVTSGAHRPDGIFLGRGKGWMEGARLPGLSILDVAPVLLYSLGLELPSVLEGKLPEAAFGEDWLRANPVRRAQREDQGAEVSGSTGQTEATAVYTEDDERVLTEYLRALGYIE